MWALVATTGLETKWSWSFTEGKWERGWAVGMKGQDSVGGVLQVSLMQQNVFGHPFGAFILEE